MGKVCRGEGLSRLVVGRRRVCGRMGLLRGGFVWSGLNGECLSWWACRHTEV